jgi:hypothetical protein
MHPRALPMTTMYEPDLLNVGIIHAPCQAVQPLLKQRLEKAIKTDTIQSAFEVVDWEEFFEQGGKLYDGRRFQIALFSPREALTVYTCNLADGWVSLYGNLVREGAFDAYFFRATLSEQAQYKVFEMQGWRHGVLERQLRALQDEDGWNFLDKGDAMPFESPMQYKKRQIGARLDRRLIERYSEAAGYRMSSVTQFRGQCWRFWRSG